MTNTRKLIPVLLVLLPVAASAQTKPLVFQSAVIQTPLLELFTSEGCSSCPPAERWFSDLKKSSGVWRQFVPVAFHVDYWDRLGWRDPWSAKAYSDRQRAYAASWRRDSVYTPGFVLNGKEWRERPLPKNGPLPTGVSAGTLQVSSTDRRVWQVSFTATAVNGTRYEAHAALLGNGLTSEVKAGENKGRRLNHDFVVLTLARAPMRADHGVAWGQLVLDPAAGGKHAQLAVAFWVTLPGRQESLQATGGSLP